MNTIPLTTKTGGSAVYTIVGNEVPLPNDSGPYSSITLIVLGRGGKFQRTEMFDRLSKVGWAEILSVENPNPSYDLEQLTTRYSRLRCMVAQTTRGNPGELINAAMRECRTPLALLLWSTMTVLPLTPRILTDLITQKLAVVTVPIIRNQRGEVLPSVSIPTEYNQGLKTLYVTPSAENNRSLFPFDYSGLYRKDLFLSMLGYDEKIVSPYWQKFEFGVRAYLWGMQIPVHQGLRTTISEYPEPEDTSTDNNYLRCYLKTLGVDFKQDHGVLDRSAFFDVYRKSGMGIFSSLKLFLEVRRWVHVHSFRYLKDFHQIVELWGEEGFEE